MKVFAYGALMSPTHMKRIGVTPTLRIPAFLEGYALRFEKKQLHNPFYGAANIQKTIASTKVFGILLELSDKDIAIIDILEEYPIGYIKEIVTVTLMSGDKVEATAYIAHPEMVAENLLPTKEYVGLICESVDILPEEYLKLIREMKTLPDSVDEV